MCGESVLPSGLPRETPFHCEAPLFPSSLQTQTLPSLGSMVVNTTAELVSSILTHAGSDGISPSSREVCQSGSGEPPPTIGRARTTTWSSASLTSE